MSVLDELDPAIEVECPRCRQTVEQQFYGPCECCLDELRAAYQAEATEVEEIDYEPKMNVTPNAVALKDD
ncbi:MAG: hypothetical protein U5K30_00235 [Acidimicrobiales bacterium]|nr:hypothetical protein [Acidimicrobiales bacterium]